MNSSGSIRFNSVSDTITSALQKQIDKKIEVEVEKIKNEYSKNAEKTREKYKDLFSFFVSSLIFLVFLTINQPDHKSASRISPSPDMGR